VSADSNQTQAWNDACFRPQYLEVNFCRCLFNIACLSSSAIRIVDTPFPHRPASPLQSKPIPKIFVASLSQSPLIDEIQLSENQVSSNTINMARKESSMTARAGKNLYGLLGSKEPEILTAVRNITAISLITLKQSDHRSHWGGQNNLCPPCHLRHHTQEQP
jgi:hypothetical protein